jgi:hypothetical protein
VDEHGHAEHAEDDVHLPADVCERGRHEVGESCRNLGVSSYSKKLGNIRVK